MIGNGRPACETHVLQPSTMASRRAEREARGELAPRERRLVSLGVKQQWLEVPGRWGKGRGSMVPIEFLYDVDNPTDRFRRLYPNGTLEPLDLASGGGQEVEPLGVVRPAGMSSGAFPDAVTDPPPERIA